MKTYKFKIEGLDCANCARELEETLNKEQGLENVSINFFTEKLTFDTENKEEALQKLKKIIRQEDDEITLEELSE